MNIATFSSIWGSSTGGIDVFNKGLVKGLASIKNKDIQICACLLVNNSALQKDSKKHGFMSATPGNEVLDQVSADSIGTWNSSSFNAVRAKMSLELRFQPDIILLHDTFCKELIPLARDKYPDAKIVTFFHSAYGRSEKKKGKADSEIDRKENFQREMLQESDLAISVGSFSMGYLQSLDSRCNDRISYVLPGLPEIQSQAVKSEYFNAMSFGRLDPKSDSIKQISLSAKAWKAALDTRSINKLKTDDVKFFAIGSNTDSSDILGNLQKELANTFTAAIRVIPFEDVQDFDSSTLKAKMESCAFILLNSWYENFGLTYLETCTFGAPVIISDNSGFFHDLKHLIGEEPSKSLLITVKTDGVDEADVLEDIKVKLIANAQNYDKVFENATELRNLIRQKWPTWHTVAMQLYQKLSSLRSRAHQGSLALESQAPIEEPLEAPPWKETVRDLFTWCWRTNTTYSQGMVSTTSISTRFKFPLTCLQKTFWDRREELMEHNFKDLILSGGTSSGKTTLAEFLFGINRPHEFTRSRILYIAPTKALAQERAKAWSELFPYLKLNSQNYDPVIVSTGDDNISDGALKRGDFIIASTVYEKANVILSASQDLFSKLNMVIVDEFHMIEDLHRGSIIECLLAKIKLEKERRMRSIEKEDNHLRMVIITTEAPGSALKNFLTFRDYDQSEDICPLVLTDTTRARSVLHSCIVPGRAKGANSKEQVPAVFDVKTFNSNDTLSLTEQEFQNVLKSFKSFRSSLTTIPVNHGYDNKRIRKEYYKEFIGQWMRNNLKGQRLLVFMNSKSEVLDVAKFIKNFIADTYKFDISAQAAIATNQTGIAFVLDVISEVESTEFSDDLKSCASQGVFIHNGDVTQKVRSCVEKYLGEGLPENCRSEIIFATETLSYGVNLKVTDVALFNVLFPEGERVQTSQPKSILLSRCDFVNMAGRAGRLNQTALGRFPQVYWYLDPEEEKSFESVLTSFYINAPEVRSQLFFRSDASALADLDRFNDVLYQGETLQNDIADKERQLLENKAIENFSYPFSRSVLDGVRFLGGTESDIGFLEKIGCSADEVITKFFFGTLYYSENCKLVREEVDKKVISRCKTKAFELVSAIRKAIESAAHPDYNLIRIPVTGGYQITPLGCSTIDTGTEIATVTKLRSSLLALNRFWSQGCTTHLPFELAILPVFFQSEVHRQYLGRLPEFRLAIEWNAAENRSDLISRAAHLLVNMKVISEDNLEATRIVLHDFMKWILKNQPVINVQGRYEEAAHDSCFRLFVAFLAWISGASLRDVIFEIRRLYPSSGQNKASSLFNFESFAENLTWKVMFMVSLIRASNDQIIPASSTFNAVRFVLRSRFGCMEKAIPLLFKNKQSNPPLNRVIIHTLLEKGNTCADIALGNSESLSTLEDSSRIKIREHIRIFIREGFQEVSRQFSYLASGTNSVRKANEDVSKEYWEFANTQVHFMLSRGTPEPGIWKPTDLADNQELSELMSNEKEGPLLVSRTNTGIMLQTYAPEFDCDDSDRISIRKANLYRADFSFGELTDLKIFEPEEVERIFIVDFPWTAGATGGVSNHCRLSPAAFGILLSLCTRCFVIDIDNYLQYILSHAPEGPIGTRKLYALSEPHIQRGALPESLFEAWAKYIEVGDSV